MKRTIFALTIILSCFISGLSLADSTPAPANSTNVTQALSPEDIVKIKEQISSLSAAINGTDNKTKPTDLKTEKKDDGLTMATVSDKLLNMVGGAVGAISQSLEKIAPQVWRIMIRQQYAKAIYAVATPLALLITFIVFTNLLWKYWWIKPDRKNFKASEDFAAFSFLRIAIPSAIMVITTICLCIDLGDAIKLLINPEYYAIKDLLTLITNPANAPN